MTYKIARNAVRRYVRNVGLGEGEGQVGVAGGGSLGDRTGRACYY